MIMKLKQIRVIALILTLVLLASSVPIPAYAVESRKPIDGITEKESGSDEAGYETVPDDETEDDIILGEVVSGREENVKHFDLGNGRYRAISYGNAVHRKDEKGQWQDIDNRLILSETVRICTQRRTEEPPFPQMPAPPGHCLPCVKTAMPSPLPRCSQRPPERRRRCALSKYRITGRIKFTVELL